MCVLSDGQEALQEGTSACAVNVAAQPGLLVRQNISAYAAAQSAFEQATFLARCLCGRNEECELLEARALGNSASINMRLAQLSSADHSAEAVELMGKAALEFGLSVQLFRQLREHDKQYKVRSTRTCSVWCYHM